MTPAQFDEFTRQLFVAFPSFNSALESHSPDKAGTLKVWFSVLNGIDFPEAMQVLGNWINGRREPPKTYEYDRIALIVRASALFDRDKGRQESESQRRAREKREATGTRKAMIDYGIDAAFQDGLLLSAKLRSGEISQYEFNERVATIVKEVK